MQERDPISSPSGDRTAPCPVKRERPDEMLLPVSPLFVADLDAPPGFHPRRWKPGFEARFERTIARALRERPSGLLLRCLEVSFAFTVFVLGTFVGLLWLVRADLNEDGQQAAIFFGVTSVFTALLWLLRVYIKEHVGGGQRKRLSGLPIAPHMVLLVLISGDALRDGLVS